MFRAAVPPCPQVPRGGGPTNCSVSSPERAQDKPSGSTKGGMRRRLDLAASFIVARAAVLDEPTTGLRPARPQRGLADDPRAGRRRQTVLLTPVLEEADQLADASP